MEKYPKYKDSGVKWIGEIPEHWGNKRLKYFCTCNDSSLSEKEDKELSIEYVEIGDVDIVNGIKDSKPYLFKDAPSRARRITQKDDVIISTVRTYLKAIAHVDKDNLIVSTGFAVLRPKDINSKFMSYALLEPYFIDSIIKMSTGVNYPAITPSKLMSLKIPIPPSSEQHAIVSFLEKETSQIESYIKLKEQEVERLNELKQAKIAHVVTKGLNPNVKMKDSGIAWIGEVPEHWEVKRNKVFLKEKKDTVGTNSDNYNLLSLTKNGVILRDIESGKGKFPKDFDSYKMVEKGNLIFCLFDLDETPRTVGLSELFGMVTGAYNVFEISNINSKYFFYLHIYIDDKKGFRPLYTGLRKVVNVNTFLSVKCPVPPKNEQQQIATYIETKVNQIDTYISITKREIEQMQEYKQRLISDAVTGKIKV